MSELPPEQRTNSQIDVATIDTATLGTLLLFLDDEAAVSDTIANKPALMIDETIAYKDSLLRKATVSLIEANNFLDTLQVFCKKVVNLNEGVGFKDSLGARSAKHGLREGLALKDTSSRLALTYIPLDKLGYNDTVTRGLYKVVNIVDAIAFSDSLGERKATVGINQFLGLSDSSTKSVKAYFTHEMIAYADSSALRPLVSLQDGLKFSDSMYRHITFQLMEQLAVKDTITNSARTVITLQSVAFGDKIIRKPIRQIKEYAALKDTSTRKVKTYIPLEKIGLNDTKLLQVTTKLKDGLGYFDTILNKPQVAIDEGVAFAEPALRRVAQAFMKEAVAFNDSITTRIIRKLKLIFTGLKGRIIKNTILTGRINHNDNLTGRITRNTTLAGKITQNSNISGKITSNTTLTAHVRIDRTRYAIDAEDNYV